jgi:hypothetical protein
VEFSIFALSKQTDMAKKDHKEIEQKDIDRLKSLKEKSKGDRDKAVQYAEVMSKSITDGYKAWRRYLASVEVYSFDSLVTIPFLGRAIELGVPEAVEEKKKIEIHRKEKTGRIAIAALGLPYDQNLSYQENIKIILRMDASIWGKVYIPEDFKKAEENKTHRLLSGIGAWD